MLEPVALPPYPMGRNKAEECLSVDEEKFLKPVCDAVVNYRDRHLMILEVVWLRFFHSNLGILLYYLELV